MQASSLLGKEFRSAIVRYPMPHINTENVLLPQKVHLNSTVTEHQDSIGLFFLL